MSEENRNDARTASGSGSGEQSPGPNKPGAPGDTANQNKSTAAGKKSRRGKRGNKPASDRSASDKPTPEEAASDTAPGRSSSADTTRTSVPASPKPSTGTGASGNEKTGSAGSTGSSERPERRGSTGERRASTIERAAPPPSSGGTGHTGVATGSGHTDGGGRSGLVIAIVALVVAVIALVAAGGLWLRGEQRVASFDSRLTTVEQSLESSVQDVLMPRLSDFDQRLQSLADDVDQRQQALADQSSQREQTLQQALASFQDTLSSFEEDLRNQQAQTASVAQRMDGNANRWQLEQIESLLRAANQRLQLYHDPQGARTALQMANETISQVGDPQLFDIREKVVNEIGALDALPTPDIEGLSLALAAMADKVPDLPLASDVPSEYPVPGSDQKGGPSQTAGQDQSQGEKDNSGSLSFLTSIDFSQGWNNFQDSVGNALSGMLTIRQKDGTQRALLPPDQAFFLSQNLQLQLRTARLALLERNTQGYRDSLASARQWLQDYYATDSSAVSGMLDRLDKISEVELDWKAPDISGSIASLREQMAQRQNGAGTSGSDAGQGQSQGQRGGGGSGGSGNGPSQAAGNGDSAGAKAAGEGEGPSENAGNGNGQAGTTSQSSDNAGQGGQ